MVALNWGIMADLNISESYYNPCFYKNLSFNRWYPSFTASVVVCTGLFGAITSFHIAKLCKVRSKEGIGLSTGTASHA